MVVGLVTVAACLAGFSQLREITAAHQALTQGALPVLIKTQAVEQDLNEMLVSLERAAVPEDAERLAQATEEVSTKIQSFRDQILTVATARGTSDLTDRMIASLDQLESSVSHLLNRQRTLFAAENQMSNRLRDLDGIRAAMRETIQVLNDDTTIRVETLRRLSGTGDAPAKDVVAALSSDLFMASLNLATLSTELETMIDLARFDQGVQTIDGFGALRVTLEMKLARMGSLVAQTGPGAHRTKLSSLTLRLDEILLGEHGLMAIAEARLTQQQSLLALRQAKFGLAREISQFVEQLAEQSTAFVAQKSQRLNTTTQLLSLVLAISLFLAGTTTLVGNSIIIEKQINRRMGRLDHAVRAIANGDLDHPIDVHGQDELGDIARALSVFKQNAEELRRSNIDLERFAYVAAHDLRSPLRAIYDLAEWTLEDEENALSNDSRTYLEMMQSRAKRLDRLLTDLLDYARAGQEDQGLADVDLTRLINQISTMLNPQGNHSIRFIGSVLNIRTHATPLTQILINLISNAIKHRDSDAVCITVDAQMIDGRLSVEVADDGPGIPLEYQQRIYELFQTLRPRDEVEGSGLGLAIIRKLLDRYKCDIHLASNPEQGRGTRFRFDFPADACVVQSETLNADAA